MISISEKNEIINMVKYAKKKKFDFFYCVNV